jgi:hypothetical protein
MEFTKLLGFYINLPIGGLSAIILVLSPIPDQMKKAPFREALFDKNVWKKFDPIGAILFVPAIIMVLLALQFGGITWPWNSPTVIGLFCGAGVTFIIFSLWELKMGDNAMIPFSIIRKRVVWSSCLEMAALFSSLLVGSYFLPIYFQAIKGVSPLTSGVYLLPTILSQLLCAVLSGFLGKSSRVNKVLS